MRCFYCNEHSELLTLKKVVAISVCNNCVQLASGCTYVDFVKMHIKRYSYASGNSTCVSYYDFETGSALVNGRFCAVYLSDKQIKRLFSEEILDYISQRAAII